ncbi:MAG: M50 family metallopeptidase [Chloroflexota bacterium]
MSIGFLGGLIFVLVFAGMILVHESGHFIAARLMRIEVEEFGIGFPPRILTLFTWKGTKFSLNWIPLGGFNRIKGEDDPTIAGGMAAAAPWKRLTVLFAGSFMNLLTAVLAYSLLFYQIGVPKTHTVAIAEVSPGSPAEKAGILAGDIVLTANGENIDSVSELQAIIRAHLDQSVSLSLKRDDQQVEISVIPSSSRTTKQGAIGVLLGTPLRPAGNWFETVPYSFQATYATVRELLALPGQIVAGAIQPQEAKLAGPRSIWNLFQQSVSRDVESREASAQDADQRPTNYTLFTIISLTISLGILNLLPIPALDGGRVLFTLPELFFRRRLPPKFEAVVHGVGFIVLLSLLGYFYILDFINPVTINLP